MPTGCAIVLTVISSLGLDVKGALTGLSTLHICQPPYGTEESECITHLGFCGSPAIVGCCHEQVVRLLPRCNVTTACMAATSKASGGEQG